MTNDAIFEGQFVQGKVSGYGSMKFNNGTRIQGIWRENQFVGSETEDFVKFKLDHLFKSPLLEKQGSALWSKTRKSSSTEQAADAFTNDLLTA